MKTKVLLGLAGLLAAITLLLASCGAIGGATGGGEGGGVGGGDGSRGMGHEDHDPDDRRDGKSGGDGGGTSNTNHSGTSGRGMARQMLTDGDGDYSDRLFIDMMVPHHEGAVEMAEVALENSDREEILDLSRDIVRTQNAEIDELRSIKEEEFGTDEIPMHTGHDQMRGMGMVMDPGSLADEEPFDRAFIDAMIPHHESAVNMANVTIEESDNPRIRELATKVLSAQEGEITRMKEWRKTWYPED